ncbi:hypothetical protein SPFL3101_03884 [Sporomusaceae bacterium FL31]|nr:hypothetical protein SPFL3101_03884 [Sporomusaceae bacterium FL31]
MQVQLQDVEAVSVAAGAPIIFDTTVSDQSLVITYAAGTVTITLPGVYYIDWWVSVDGIEGGTAIVPTFAITTSAADNIQASSPLITDQMSGTALIAVAAPPVTLQLVNATDSTIGFGLTPIRANLTIINVTV